MTYNFPDQVYVVLHFFISLNVSIYNTNLNRRPNLVYGRKSILSNSAMPRWFVSEYIPNSTAVQRGCRKENTQLHLCLYLFTHTYTLQATGYRLQATVALS